ncbi:MAG: M23 family metallopeptidase [Treponemataceae bacterium]
MPKVRRYKRIEKKLALASMNLIKSQFKKIIIFCKSFFNIGTRKLTIMIVPHSQKSVFNFQTNFFGITLGVILVLGIVTSFFVFNSTTITANSEIARLQQENTSTRASLDELRSENSNLIQVAKKFQTALSQTLSFIGVNQAITSDNSFKNSDLASLFDRQEIVSGSLRETADVKNLTAYLEQAVQPIEEIGKLLEAQGSLFSDIPSVWPLRGGVGHISFPFGQNIHPITGQWYIHKGMDFSTWRSGDPIITTANGQVVTVGYDTGLGKYVIVKHKHGFYTRYAHMNAIHVEKGQFLSQGDILGTVGNTGISTGPHLHYEIHIGSDVVDPAKYVNVTSRKTS